MNTRIVCYQPLRICAFVIATLTLVSTVFAQTTNKASRSQEKRSPIVWKWAGFEVMGQRSVTRDEIIKQVPLEIGTEYKTDFESWKKWAQELEQQFSFFLVKVSAVRFVGGKAYLVINVVEHENKSVVDFRADPTGHAALPVDVLATYRKMSAHQQSLFEKGTPPREKLGQGFLDFEQDALSQMANELAKIVPQHRLSLLKTLEQEADKRTRATAATLLNWGGDLEKSIVESLPYLKDSSSGVRNNLTRFMLHYFDEIQSPETRQIVINAIVPQLSLPSHGDRNKAIYALKMLAERDDNALKSIMKRAGKQIRYIADNSILYNVRDPAIELLKLADESAAN